jgi:hypothetical protein
MLTDKRHQRCTGVALNVAITLLEVLFLYHFNMRVHFQIRIENNAYTGGPCTVGPGDIINARVEQKLLWI